MEQPGIEAGPSTTPPYQNPQPCRRQPARPPRRWIRAQLTRPGETACAEMTACRFELKVIPFPPPPEVRRPLEQRRRVGECRPVLGVRRRGLQMAGGRADVPEVGGAEVVVGEPEGGSRPRGKPRLECDGHPGVQPGQVELGDCAEDGLAGQGVEKPVGPVAGRYLLEEARANGGVDPGQRSAVNSSEAAPASVVGRQVRALGCTVSGLSPVEARSEPGWSSLPSGSARHQRSSAADT